MKEDDPLSDIPDSVFDYSIDSYYHLLQVDKRAAQAEVKRAYREKIQEYHPDSSDHEHAQAITFALNQAKQVLLNQNNRVRYNEVGHDQYYSETLTNVDSFNDEDVLDENDGDVSIYELIMLAKLDNYTSEAWWKTVLKSTGFKIILVVVGFLSAIGLSFVFI